MKPIKFEENTKRRSEIFFCDGGAFRELPKRLQSYAGALLFTDSNVYRIYETQIKKSLRIPVFVMEAGEEHKNGQTLFSLLKAMAGAGLHRSSCLVALGGGVVGDVGGLAASLYMRGIACIQVPTTLLSQVDSSVGGKTAIDFEGYKNLVGSFYQPDCVLVDGDFLSTLPKRELRCGLGEIVKHAALSAEIFKELRARSGDLFALDFLRKIVPVNVAYKAQIVGEDAHEHGKRKCLNLGHTTAHAMELYYGKLSHGEFVLMGILYEAAIALRLVKEADEGYLRELCALARAALCDKPLSAYEAARFARLDKKNATSDSVTLVAPLKPGEYEVIELDYRDYEALLKEIGQELC